MNNVNWCWPPKLGEIFRNWCQPSKLRVNKTDGYITSFSLHRPKSEHTEVDEDTRKGQNFQFIIHYL